MSIFGPIAEEDQTAISEWLTNVNSELSEIVRGKSRAYSYDFLADVEIPDPSNRFQWQQSPTNPKVKVRRCSLASYDRSSISTSASLENDLSGDTLKIQTLTLEFSNMNSGSLRHDMQDNLCDMSCTSSCN